MLPAAVEKQTQQIPPSILTSEPTSIAVENHPSTVENHATKNAPQENSDGHPAPHEIEVEAYNLYLARGCQDGFDVEDWLAAEELLRHRQSE